MERLVLSAKIRVHKHAVITLVKRSMVSVSIAFLVLLVQIVPKSAVKIVYQLCPVFVAEMVIASVDVWTDGLAHNVIGNVP